MAKFIPAGVKAAGIRSVARWLNMEFERQMAEPRHADRDNNQEGNRSLLAVPVGRGGSSYYGGIFWFDMDAEQSQPAHDVGPQIFGHTLTMKPEGHSYASADGKVIDGPRWVSLMGFQAPLIYDTELDKILPITDL